MLQSFTKFSGLLLVSLFIWLLTSPANCLKTLIETSQYLFLTTTGFQTLFQKKKTELRKHLSFNKFVDSKFNIIINMS